MQRRTWASWVVVAVGLPLLTRVLVSVRDTISLETALLLYLLLVVVIALLGGAAPGLVAAVAADLLVNYFFVPPYKTLQIESRDNVIALLVFVLVAGVVSVLVELAARRREESARVRAEAAVLARITDAPVGGLSPASVLAQVRSDFHAHAVELVDEATGGVVVAVGERVLDDVVSTVPAGASLVVRIHGDERWGTDLATLGRLATVAGRSYEEQVLTDQALEAERLAELDRTRSALLAAVGHDLRTPLAGVKAAVTGLLDPEVTWTPQQQHELLLTIDASADRLDRLVANLLDATRIQAGAVAVDRHPTALDEVVLRCLVHVADGAVAVSVPETLPLVDTDPVLLERVLDNLLANALRFTPSGTQVRVVGVVNGAAVELTVVDHGPGLPAKDRQRIFEPFQRLGDRSQGGTGLGLAIAKGFCDAVGADLAATDTPGGGLTMTVTVPVAW